jgi:hypothetical protein
VSRETTFKRWVRPVPKLFAAASEDAGAAWMNSYTRNNKRPVRLAYQPPASSTFLSQQTSHQQPVLFSQNKPTPATSQPNRLKM